MPVVWTRARGLPHDVLPTRGYGGDVSGGHMAQLSRGFRAKQTGQCVGNGEFLAR